MVWNRSRLTVVVAALVLAGVALYLISPLVSLWRLRQAAERYDTAALEEMIDFPAVRASLKEQASEAVRNKVGGVLRNRTVTGLIAGTLGPQVVDRLIDQRVTPAAIAQMIKGAQIEHASFSGPCVFTFQTANLKASTRFTGAGWRVFWVELPGSW
jgi:hypothetical protein